MTGEWVLTEVVVVDVSRVGVSSVKVPGGLVWVVIVPPADSVLVVEAERLAIVPVGMSGELVD